MAAQEHIWWILRFWMTAKKSAFLGWISIEVHCSWLCLNRMTFSIESDQSLTPGESGRWCIRAPRFSEMAKQHSPRQQKDHRARKHSFFLPLSRTADRRLNIKQPIEDKKEGKMRALPPFSECTGLSVGGLGHYSVLFGFIIAYQFSSNSLIVGE